MLTLVSFSIFLAAATNFSDDAESVVGRLARCVQFWVSIGASPTVLDWIQHGVLLKFWKLPTKFKGRNHINNPVHAKFVEKEVLALVQSGAIREVSRPPAIISPISVVPKRTGDKLRLVINLRHINQFLPERAFKYESLKRVGGDILEKGVWLFKIDLKSGYHHVTMHESSRKFLGFEFNSKFYEFCVLPFGLSLAPFIFTKVTRQLIQFWREQGIRVLGYIDDFLFVASSREEAIKLRSQILSDLSKSGFVKSQKSMLEPSQIVEFLGYVIDSISGQYQVSQEKISFLIEFLKRICAAPRVYVKDVAKAAGLILSMSLALQPARMYTRSFYRLIATRKNWYEKLHWSEEALADGRWWIDNLQQWNGKTIWVHQQKFELEVFSDASSLGFGGRIGELTIQDVWSPEEMEESINWKELTAVYRILLAAGNNFLDKALLIRSDNSSTVAYINNGGGRVEKLNTIAKQIWQLCINFNCNLQAEWIAGVDNQEADYLSRVFEWNNFRINPSYFEYINQCWGPFSIDRMASWQNTVLPRFNSRAHDPYAEAYDAFTQNWAGENNWIFPDFNLVSNVLQHLRLNRAKGAVVLPHWPSQSWWPVAKEAALDWILIPREEIWLDQCDSANKLPNGDIYVMFFDFQ